MKIKREAFGVFIFLFFLLSSQLLYSQKVTIGLNSGINFSNPRGEFTGGRWKSLTGPSEGVFIRYDLLRCISLQTELNYSTLYFKHLNYKSNGNNYYYPIDLAYNDRISMPIYYYNADESWELNTLHIPVSIRYATPTRLKFEFSAGMYWSFTLGHNYTGPIYNNYYGQNSGLYSYLPYYESDVPDKDFGYCITTGFSYPFNEKFSVSMEGEYYAGKKTFFKSMNGRVGAYELRLGISYRGLFQRNKRSENNIHYTDTVKIPIAIRLKTGISISSINGDNHNHGYSARASFTSGISLVLSLDKHFALVTELLEERKGYKMKGMSNSFYRFMDVGSYNNDNLIDLDYFVVPVLFNISMGNTFKFYVNTGPYLGFLLSARVTGTATSENRWVGSYSYTKTHVYDRIDGNIRSHDLGWVFGSGIEFPIYKKISFDLEARYSAGFNYFFEDIASQTSDMHNSMIKNISYTISAGIRIPIHAVN
jgi:hypothetical protein